jgi:hypothetical protein
MSIGAGYNIRNRYEPTLLVGYLNNTFGNSTISVTTVSLKNSFNMLKRQMPDNIKLKGGISVNLGYTNNTFKNLPPHYPDNYYFQNLIFLSPIFGGEWLININSRHIKAGGLYFEFNTRDAYVLEFVRRKYVSFDKIWNLGLGITLYIH